MDVAGRKTWQSHPESEWERKKGKRKTDEEGVFFRVICKLNVI